MAYSTPLTAVSNSTLTAAQWNASVRDNMLVTPAALATAAGQFFVSSAANAIAARTPQYATVATSQTTTSIATYGDLATVGPAVTVTTGATALVIFGAQIENSTGAGGGLMSFAVSNATTIAAPATANALRFMASNADERNAASRVNWLTTLNPGSNTFTCKYTTPTGGTAAFSGRDIIVIPF